MEFQILSHAGLRVSDDTTELICDPWLLGSAYWRSWWNYPPVAKNLIEKLNPDFIYLTHIHWDHFHGPSLRRFPKTTKIVIPKGNYQRIKRDLNRMGFQDVIELKHGERLALSEKFTITSYQFGIFLDSALIIECDGVTLLNANDAKLMGGPLDQVLKRHPRIDFVFRSHSSANSRLCYEIIDSPKHPVDDMDYYIKSFALFVQRCNAKYAIPFASNHCFLHKEVFHYNNTIQTPQMVEKYFRSHQIKSPEVKVMLSGDTWSTAHAFTIQKSDYFATREKNLDKYRENVHQTLDATYTREAKAEVTQEEIDLYFNAFCKAVPYLIRRRFRNHPILYKLTSGEKVKFFEIDLFQKTSQVVIDPPIDAHPIQIHTSAAIFRHCMKLNLFSHLSISKRVKYRVTLSSKKYITLLNLLFNFYEYDMLPLRKVITPRFFETWLLRWREILLYVRIMTDYIRKKGVDVEKYLAPSKAYTR